MKILGLEQTTLDSCVAEAQRQRVVLTRDGKPVALLVGLEGLDTEQVGLGSSDAFWSLMAARRGQATLTRAELEERLNRP